MRVTLSGVQRHQLYQWLEQLGQAEGWQRSARLLAEQATAALGFPVTADHILPARRAMLPKPPKEPTVEARLDDYERRLLTLEGQVAAIASVMRAQGNKIGDLFCGLAGLRDRIAKLEPRPLFVPPLDVPDLATLGNEDPNA